MTKTITTAELAAELDTTPRELRKFLRADAKVNEVETPGKGKRYALPANARSIAAMRKKFSTWQDAQKVRTEVDTTESDTEVNDEVSPDEDDAEELDMNDDELASLTDDIDAE